MQSFAGVASFSTTENYIILFENKRVNTRQKLSPVRASYELNEVCTFEVTPKLGMQVSKVFKTHSSRASFLEAN